MVSARPSERAASPWRALQRRFLLAASLAALLASGSCELKGDPGPQAVVAEFCRLDLLGERLKDEPSAAIEKYYQWEKPEPWSRIVVIEGYRVSNPRTRGQSAEVTVTYHVMGHLQGESWTSNASGTGWRRTLSIPEIVTFQLDSTDGKTWLIRSPLVPPHVSVSTVADRLPPLIGEGS